MSDVFKTRLLHDDTSTLMWYWHIQLPQELIPKYEKTDKRICCSINGNKAYHAALMPDGNGNYSILVNKERRKKYAIEIGDEVEIIIEQDTSEYGMEVPEIFYSICEDDPEGNVVFHALTKGKQRSLLHFLGKVKSEAKQVEKWLTLFDYLKSVNGNLDFKELNEAFKNSRFKI